MAARGRPRRRKVLSVVFDTNAIFHKEFDTLVCQAASDLIARHSNHGDLGIRWVIPEIVRGEREYQMRNEFRNVSPHVAKVESLFGGVWGVTQAAVEQRIAARIDEELAALRIEVVPCVSDRVDWDAVMRRACFREPPFERGQTEKGFRDAVTCETFIQIAEDLAGSDTAVLVSKDRLVKQYIESCGIEGHRARVVDDLDALDDEIQLRVANVDEDTQTYIERRAQLLFFPWGNPSDPNSLWARERIGDRIWEEYGNRLRLTPPGTTHVIVRQELSNARLVSKDGPRVHFESTLWIQSGFRIWTPAPDVRVDTPPTTLASLIGIGKQPPGRPELTHLGPQTLLGSSLTTPAGEWKEVEKPSKDVISIHWSATFTRRRTLTRASIDSINMVDPPIPAAALGQGLLGLGG